MSDATPEPGRTYESAVGRLEEIIARLDSGQAELRETLALCGEAKDLIVFCRDELTEVSGRSPSSGSTSWWQLLSHESRKRVALAPVDQAKSLVCRGLRSRSVLSFLR